MHPPPAEDREELDALRRRLYAPAATAEDLERYRGALAVDAGDHVPEPDADGRAEPALHRRASGAAPRRAALAVVVAVALIGCIALLLPGGPPRPPVPEGSDPAQQVLPVPAAARDGFRAALRQGGHAGVQQYLYEHPGARPSSLTGIGRVDSEEWSGTGTRSIELHPSATALRGGRAVLMVVLDRGRSARWGLSRIAVREDHARYRQVVAGGVLRSAPGAPAAVAVAYDAPGPTRLRVEVPRGVRWGAVVAFTD